MAETQLKRSSEESSHDSATHESYSSHSPNSKRQKPCNNILSLLDQEESEDQEPNQDLTAIFTTLQQELSTTTTTTAAAAAFDFDFLPFTAAETTTSSDLSSGESADEDEGVKSVMRHLFEASDDELGIPNTEDNHKYVEINSADKFPFSLVDNGLWELEDVAANYYTMLQSEFFI